MAPYCHAPLLQPNGIRLLRLLPTKEDSKNIQCELFECALRPSDGAARPYEALSYVWGSTLKPESITIVDQKRDRQFAITQSLHAALLRLRDHDIPRIIWIDAICIDQSNKTERSHQIPLMAEIYAKASRVVVWLGEEKDNSDQALEEVRLAAAGSLDLSKAPQPSRQVITTLLERSWFERVWVGQQHSTTHGNRRN
jgi:hypothetical protein